MVALFGMFLLTLLVLTAVAIIRERNLFVAVILSAIYSLLMASNFFILDAADVALTEAAIGAGIATVLFLAALALTAEQEKPVLLGRRSAAVAVLTLLLASILYSTADNPRVGDPAAPVHQHVAPWYLEQTPELIDIPNVVTAVLASYRGYDTLGELLVVLTAGIGVLFVLSAGRDHVLPQRLDVGRLTHPGLRRHEIPMVHGKLLVPFIILFGMYVQFHGEFGPGGGFQAGALIAAGIILYGLLEGERRALTAVPAPLLFAIALAGAALFLGIGVAGIALGGNFLDYNVLAEDPVTGQQWGILGIELAVGMTVMGVLLCVHHSFASRGLTDAASPQGHRATLDTAT
jgi:multicomponent Na+:H+ antiporter subunit B